MGNTDFDKDLDKNKEQPGGQKQAAGDHSGRQGHGQGGSLPPQADKDGSQKSEGSSGTGHKGGRDDIGNR